MHLLDHEAPGLRDKLQAMSPALRRRKLIEAAVAASRRIDDLEPAMQQLLEVAVRNGTLSAEQVVQARAYAESADDRYFTLQEQGVAEAIWKNWFAKSRLATAIVNLFGSESWQDAAYELCFTQDDKCAAVSLLRAHVEATPEDNSSAVK